MAYLKYIFHSYPFRLISLYFPSILSFFYKKIKNFVASCIKNFLVANLKLLALSVVNKPMVITLHNSIMKSRILWCIRNIACNYCATYHIVRLANPIICSHLEETYCITVTIALSTENFYCYVALIALTISFFILFYVYKVDFDFAHNHPRIHKLLSIVCTLYYPASV